MPKVSVIVPVYNVEKYLKRCVDSILNQIFTDFELILVNDGSFDNCGKICDEYAKMDSRIKVIHKENGGVSSARNAGIDLAVGEYIMFVDSDDCIKVEMLEKMISIADSDIDLVVSSIEMICENATSEYILPSIKCSTLQLITMYCNEEFPRICLCGPVCKLYRNDVIKSNNIKFNIDLSLGEDTHFNMIYISYCNKISLTDKIYYSYIRENKDSLFSRFQESTYGNSKFVYEFTYEIAKKVGCNNEALLKLEQIYVNDLIGNTLKACNIANKKVCISYLKSVSEDEYLKENIKKLNCKYRFVGNMLLKRQCNLLYCIYKLIKIFMIK